MATSGLSCRRLLVGAGWAISLLLCMNGLRNQSSVYVGTPFLAVKLFSQSVGATIYQELWLLKKVGVVWVTNLRRMAEMALCEVTSFKSENVVCLRHRLKVTSIESNSAVNPIMEPRICIKKTSSVLEVYHSWIIKSIKYWTKCLFSASHAFTD